MVLLVRVSVSAFLFEAVYLPSTSLFLSVVSKMIYKGKLLIRNTFNS